LYIKFPYQVYVGSVFRIQKVLADIVESHFKPAIQNMKENLGEEKVSGIPGLLEEVCMAALEHAKELYAADMKKPAAATPLRGKCPSQVLKRSASSNSNSPIMRKSMVIKSGKKISFAPSFFLSSKYVTGIYFTSTLLANPSLY
jgi:hypothetical protein